MPSHVEIGTDNTDDPIDVEIEGCLNPDQPKSFFLYAGAGSGKTYSLVKGLRYFEEKYERGFRRSGKKVGVITYTNAACDEIIERVEGNPLFHISTIHSFCWLQIKAFHDDIREWLKAELPAEIAELELLGGKGRAGTQASITRQRSIANKTTRLKWLSERREFTYNPNGDNIGKDSLSHAEVIKICSDFLITKPSFQQILINRYPFLLIDESQDTNKQLIEALFVVESSHQGNFCLGLIGDMMQRIYGDGKSDLGENLPDNWVKPIKQMNRRSPSRIVSLANDIRSESDGQRQRVLDGSEEGIVRLFIASSNTPNKPDFEQRIREEMSGITGDPLWNDQQEVKHLMLEHMMAAVRMEFSGMYSALKASKIMNTALNSGDLPAVKFFSDHVLPLYQLEKDNMGHSVMNHLRRVKSPLLDPGLLRAYVTEKNPLDPLKTAIKSVVDLIDNNPNVSFHEVLTCVAKNNLFSIPQSLLPFSEEIEQYDEDRDEKVVIEDGQISSLDAIANFLITPFKQILSYKEYVSGQGAFDTHQGVKGREFDRVFVVMDDNEAAGFMFSYEKLFEVKPPTKGDVEKQSKGEETGIDRTRRLFYVTCTRAKKSLALVAYSEGPGLLKEQAIAKGWFSDDEAIVL
ncbi:MAG: UvrD-helicase domain-containing protein [Candidatus Thiodiazotropha sp.]